MRLVAITRSGHPAEPVEAAAPALDEVLAATAALYARKGYAPPWIGYLAVEGGACVGTCAFAAPPNGDEVEIAYFTFPGHEGAGVATRMGRELLKIAAEAEPRRLRACAHTLPEENASTAILRKLGFTLEGEIVHPEDGRIWKWQQASGPVT